MASCDSVEVSESCPLGLASQRFHHAVATGDYQEAKRLFEADMFAVGYGHPPTESLRDMGTVIQQLPDPGDLLPAVYRVFTTISAEDLHSGEVLEGAEFGDPRLQLFFMSSRMATLRTRGEAWKSLDLVKETEQLIASLCPSGQTTDGWVLHAMVQTGSVIMAAGELGRAKRIFARVQAQQAPPGFTFFIRDCLIRTALIEASYGDASAAQGMLDRADQVKRTASWVEYQLDTQAQLARAMVQKDPYVAWQVLEHIDRHQLGELWPFYVIVLKRVMRAGGYHHELQQNLEAIDAMPLARFDGQGLCGSVLPLQRAELAMASGLHQQAQALLQRADSSMDITRLYSAAADLYAGRPRRAMKVVEGLCESSPGLRLLNLRCLAISAAALQQLGDDQGALATVREAKALSGSLTETEIRQFSPQVRTLARSSIDGWNDDATLPSLFLDSLPEAGLSLSAREQEILRKLALGRSREQIGAELFISINTLKSQLRSIYRKLQVSSAAEAVREAEQRGLL